MISLTDGRVITIDNYFTEGGTANVLSISTDGYLNEVALIGTGAGDLYAQFDLTEQRGKWSPSDDPIYLGRTEVASAAAGAVVSCSEAMSQELKLAIARLRRDTYGILSERRARLIGQAEFQLEEWVAPPPGARLHAGHPVRKPFPDHLPRKRVVAVAPAACTCCGSDRIVKVGQDVTKMRGPRVTRALCRTHARRKFFEPTVTGRDRQSDRAAGVLADPSRHAGLG